MYNQEVTRIPGIGNGIQLKIQALGDVRGDLAVALLGSFVSDVLEVGILSTFAAVLGIFGVLELFRDVERRQQHVVGQAVGFNLVQDRTDGQDGLRQICKERLHFIGALDVETVIGEAVSELAAPLTKVALGFVDRFGVAYAEQYVVRFCLGFGGVVGVVGRNVFDAMCTAHAQQGGVDHVFLFQSVAVDFHIEIVAEVLFPPEQGFFGFALALVQHGVGHFTPKSSGEYNQVLLVFKQDVFVDAGDVVEPLGVGR